MCFLSFIRSFFLSFFFFLVAPVVSSPSDGKPTPVGGVAKDPGYVFAVDKLGRMLSATKN